ncbi:MAG: hypothetical protein QXX79_00565 [Candidatus Bathyarchaeia archaeon]
MKDAVVENLYAVWIKIDEALPWVELNGTYQTREEARKTAKQLLSKVKVKIVRVKRESRKMKALVTIKR